MRACPGTAAYNDNVAKLAGETGAIEALVKLLRSDDATGQCQRYAAYAMQNVAMYDPNKRKILDAGGVEALTSVYGSSSHEARDLAGEVLEILADLAAEEDLEEIKSRFGLGGMVDLLRTTANNPLVAGTAADALAEKVTDGERRPGSKSSIRQYCGAAESHRDVAMA